MTASGASGHTIRAARPGDAEAVARLLAQLGYEVGGDDISERLPGVLALVAEEGGDVAGVVTAAIVPVVHDRPWCRITALVVDERRRGGGIGAALVVGVEAAARQAGCARIEATSALDRAGAHAFYERLGYGRVSEHLLKRL